MLYIKKQLGKYYVIKMQQQLQGMLHNKSNQETHWGVVSYVITRNTMMSLYHYMCTDMQHFYKVL